MARRGSIYWYWTTPDLVCYRCGVDLRYDNVRWEKCAWPQAVDRACRLWVRLCPVCWYSFKMIDLIWGVVVQDWMLWRHQGRNTAFRPLINTLGMCWEEFGVQQDWDERLWLYPCASEDGEYPWYW